MVTNLEIFSIHLTMLLKPSDFRFTVLLFALIYVYVVMNLSSEHVSKEKETGTKDSAHLGSLRKLSELNQTAVLTTQTSKTEKENDTEKRNCVQEKVALNLLEKDTFWFSDKEALLHIRSAYLDFRFDPPKTQILTLMGYNLSSNPDSIVCHYVYQRQCQEFVRNVNASVVFLHERERTKCFFKEVIVRCSFPKNDPPDYVAVSVLHKGKYFYFFIHFLNFVGPGSILWDH